MACALLFRAVPMRHTKQKTNQPTGSAWREQCHEELSRRQFVTATAMSSAALITAPYVRGAYAAGKLSMGFWDHWVPGANKTLTDLVNEWAAKEKVEAQIDYITSQGNKILLTIAAEAQAKSGHDILVDADLAGRTPMPNCSSPSTTSWSRSSSRTATVNGTVKYLGQANGKWLGVPACVGSQIKGPCSRIDLMKKYANIDVQANVSGGQPAESRQLDHGNVPESGGGLLQGRLSPSASVSARPPTASIPPARSSSRSVHNSSTPRAISPSRPTRCARRWSSTRS